MKLTNIRDQIDMLYGPPLSVLSDCLRGFLIPAEGHDFIGGDFSAIEARVLAWLAGEERVLSIFRGHGKIYEAAAADIYGGKIEDITKDQRQVGKVAILALGYGGGKRAFQAMAKGYNVTVSDKQAEIIKERWRRANGRIVSYWYLLEDAAVKATLKPGTVFTAGAKGREVAYRKSGSFLWCKLPSGRVLCYPYPEIQQVETPWGSLKDALTYMGSDTITRKWGRQTTYGGSLSENVTQAVARDLLAEALLRLEHAQYPVVMHVHDEVLCEVPVNFGSVEELEFIMSTLPTWGAGLPISAEGWRGRRYRK